MSTYIYAIASNEYYNEIHTVTARSLKDAQEKIIEKYREELDIDDEFNNWKDFINFMRDHEIDITSTIQDIETL